MNRSVVWRSTYRVLNKVRSKTRIAGSGQSPRARCKFVRPTSKSCELFRHLALRRGLQISRIAVEPAGVKVPDIADKVLWIVVLRHQVWFLQIRLGDRYGVQDLIETATLVHHFDRLARQYFQRLGAVA